MIASSILACADLNGNFVCVNRFKTYRVLFACFFGCQML